MRLATRLRKWIYPAILVLLPLVIAGGSPGQALAQTYAAKYIGADVESSTSPPTWPQVNTPGSGYDLHSPQSEKFFYNGPNGLPSSDTAKTTTYGTPGCGATKSDGSYVYATNVLCIIVWNTANSADGSDLHAFLESTLNDPHQIFMAFCNEPETEVAKKQSCTCDTTSVKTPCKNGVDFINQFEVESTYIANFESSKKAGAPNVRVAEDSGVDYYNQNSGSCGMKNNPGNYIVPTPYVSFYLADVYEPNKTTLPAQDLSQNNGWNNWVNCTTNTAGVARGIGEYGIDCGDTSSGVRTASLYDGVVAATYKADAKYLIKKFSNLEVWNLWDAGGCTIDSIQNDPNYAPQALAAWQAIAQGVVTNG